MAEVLTLNFVDASGEGAGVVIIRTTPNSVGLCLSLESNGDTEVFLSPQDARRVASALTQAINTLS
jgi:hypothetical protein